MLGYKVAKGLFIARMQTDSAGGPRNAVPYSIPGSLCASQPDNRLAINLHLVLGMRLAALHQGAEEISSMLPAVIHQHSRSG